MDSTDSGTTRTRGRLRGQRIGNAIVRFLLRSPAHRLLSGRLMLVTVTGRRTGARYVIPVGYAAHEGTFLVGTAAGWKRNLDPAVTVPVLVRGARLTASAEVLTGEAAVPAYEVVLRHNPVHGRFAGIGVRADGSPDPDDLRRALRDGAAVVRFRPV